VPATVLQLEEHRGRVGSRGDEGELGDGVTVPMPGAGGLDAALAAVVDGARRFVEEIGTAPCLVIALAGPDPRAAFDLVWRDDVERDVLVTAVTTVSLALGVDRLAAAVVGTVPDRPGAVPGRPGAPEPVSSQAIVGLTVTADGVTPRQVLPFAPAADGAGGGGGSAGSGGWTVGDAEAGDVRLGGDLGGLFGPVAAALRPDGAYVPSSAELTAAYVNLREAGCVVRTDSELTAS
jgi:hypothetical protein